jgi:hypothetical protein
LARRKKKLAPRYTVNVALKAWDIAKAGSAIRLKVHDRDELLGTIEIGQGTFGWKSARRRSGYRRLPWRKVAGLLDDA